MSEVRIKRIKTNFQVRFGYIPKLTEYIKKQIPKDQIHTKMESFVNEDGLTSEDWFRVCNIGGLSRVLWFCKDNNIEYKYDKVKDSDIERIEKFAKDKRDRNEKAEEVKKGTINAENENYDFMQIQPYPYQKQAVAFFEAAGGVALLGDQPGVGKTLSAIAYGAKHQLKTLIICPSSLKLNWRKEVLRFTNEKAHVFKYKPKKKEKTINYTSDESLFHIINYEALSTYLKFDVNHKCQNAFCDWEETNQVKKYKACPKCFKEKSVKSRNADLCTFVDKTGVSLKLMEYDLVVCDEAHYIKESSATRTKIIKTACKPINRKILLTGTAIKNRPYEFFSLLNFLDPHEWVNAHNFGVRYCDGKIDEWDHWHYDGCTNSEELYGRISNLFFRRLKSDVLKFLPPKTFTVIPIELSTEEQREYRNLEDGIVEDSDKTDDKMTHLARLQKLKQLTSRIKAEKAVEFIQNIIDGDEKIVVFTQFLAVADYIYEAFKDKAVLFTGKKSMSEKQDAVERFQNDERIQVFVGSIGAASEGITLTAASVALFIDQPWEPSTRQQCEDRIHRVSQVSENVQIIRLICQSTIDEDINELLDEKEKVVSKILDGEEIVNKAEHSIFDDIVNTILRKKNF